MSAQQYTRVTVVVHPDALEGISDAFFALGAKGVVDEGSETNRKVYAYFPDDGRTQERLTAVERRVDDLRAAGVDVGAGFISAQVVEAEEWSQAWKTYFHTERVTPNLVIRPTWESYRPQPGEHVIVLDPGAAFGTGGHATTRLCLRALAEHVHPGDTVADVGSGSGILSIAAALLGASRVVATDADPTTIPVAQENVRLNGVADRVQVMESDLLPTDRGPFDVVVCNILALEVIRLAPQLPGLLVPGGRFIGSGFIDVSVDDVRAALGAAHLEVISVLEEQEWAAIIAAYGGERVESGK